MSSCDYQYYKQDFDISRNQENYGSVRISRAVYEFVARESNGSWLSHFLLDTVTTSFCIFLLCFCFVIPPECLNKVHPR